MSVDVLAAVREWCDRTERQINTRQEAGPAVEASWFLAGELTAVLEVRALLALAPVGEGP